jgi:divalent metal cation (Fe/Co/Zn/Cd) transporter
MVFEGFAWYFAWKEFRKVKGKRGFFDTVSKEKDPTIFVVLFEDTAAMLGLIVAFLGIWLGQVTGILILDGVASIVIGIILALTAAWLAYETKGLLIGESANMDIIDGVTSLADSFNSIDTVNETLTMHMGPNFILLTLSVDFKNNLDTGSIERSISQITKKIKSEYPGIKRVFIEAEQS